MTSRHTASAYSAGRVEGVYGTRHSMAGHGWRIAATHSPDMESPRVSLVLTR
jgi:hypothetical protein